MRPRRVHPSWVLTSGSAAFVGGVVVAKVVPPHTWVTQWWLIGGLCMGVVSLLIGNRSAAIATVVTGGVLIGCWRGSVYKASLLPYGHHSGQVVSISGKVAVDPEEMHTGEVRFKLDGVAINGVHAGGMVWVTTHERAHLKRSDQVQVEGVITPGFGTLAATMYRAHFVSVSRVAMEDPGLGVRDKFTEAVRLGIKDPEASLANGFLVGAQSSLPEKLDTELKLLGLSHIVVASGYNLTILVRFARRALSRISRFTSFAGALLLVLLFMAIVGMSPSMMRAGIVSIMSLAAWFFGRKVHPIVLLGISAGLSVLLRPDFAWGDIGWLLSFGSFIGVLIIGPLIHAYFWSDTRPGFIRQLLVETFAAYMVTLPLVVFVFGRFSPLSVLANAAVLPLISPIMALTFVGAAVSLFLPSIARAVSFPSQFLLEYITMVVDKLSKWPIASKEVAISWIGMLLSYSVIAGVVLFLWRHTRYDFRNFNVVE